MFKTVIIIRRFHFDDVDGTRFLFFERRWSVFVVWVPTMAVFTNRFVMVVLV